MIARSRVRRLQAVVGRIICRGLLVSRLPRHGVGAEVGTWKGDFAALVLLVNRPVRLHLIDPWEYVYDADRHHDPMFGGSDPTGQQRMDGIHDRLRRRFAREIAAGQVRVWRARSTDAAAGVERLDWVYIDANHAYEEVKRDLEAFYPLVRIGGVIAGDDYGSTGHTWFGDGVRLAVEEFAATHGCRLRVIGSQFLLTKTDV